MKKITMKDDERVQEILDCILNGEEVILESEMDIQELEGTLVEDGNLELLDDLNVELFRYKDEVLYKVWFSNAA